MAILSDKTTTTLGTLAIVGAALISFMLYLNGKFEDTASKDDQTTLKKEMAEVRGELKDLSFKVSRIDEKVSDYVTRDEFENWVLRFARDNAGKGISTPETHR